MATQIDTYIQSSDPGAVGAGKLWIDNSGAPTIVTKQRNVGNTGWTTLTSFAHNSTTGETGATGTQWRTGSAVPTNSVGNDGDLYLRTTNGDVYQRASGVYTIITNITGAGLFVTGFSYFL